MKTKLIEIRDSCTLIIALCIDMQPDNEAQRWGLRRYGYPCDGKPNIMMTHATGERKASNDPYFWNDRTFSTAHHYIIEHWHELKDGDVVCVEWILGERRTPKISERDVQRSVRS
jgi:hypothetical protein